MGKPRIGHLASAALCIGICSGCWFSKPEPLPVWAKTEPTYQPDPNSRNAYDQYALAAKTVEATAGGLLKKVYFYSKDRKVAAAVCEAPIGQIERAQSSACEFKFVSHSFFAPSPGQGGFRLIGHVLRWKIDSECGADKPDFDSAIRDFLIATRLGFDLTGGDATDVSLGMSIADEARVGIGYYLSKMSAEQLQQLGDSTYELLNTKPPIDIALGHERQNMEMAVQNLQDAFVARRYDEYQLKLGTSIKDSLQYLQSVEGNQEAARKFFMALHDEGEAEATRIIANSKLPLARRPEKPKLRKGQKRYWRQFVPHFFYTAAPVLDINDRTLARTRLLVLNTWLMARNKRKMAYPKSVDEFPVELVTDPYSGSKFLYRADTTEYDIYSVGLNLRDDSGETDGSFSYPDLKLELRG